MIPKKLFRFKLIINIFIILVLKLLSNLIWKQWDTENSELLILSFLDVSHSETSKMTESVTPIFPYLTVFIKALVKHVKFRRLVLLLSYRRALSSLRELRVYLQESWHAAPIWKSLTTTRARRRSPSVVWWSQNGSATCYMNAVTQQIFMMPSWGTHCCRLSWTTLARNFGRKVLSQQNI